MTAPRTRTATGRSASKTKSAPKGKARRSKPAPVQRLLADLREKPSLRTEILLDQLAVLKRYKVSLAELGALREAFKEAAVLPKAKLKERVAFFFPWPPPGEEDIEVNSVDPSSADLNVKTSFTIIGSGFSTNYRVAFALPAPDAQHRVDAKNVVVVDSTMITCKAKLDQVGKWDVYVGTFDEFGKMKKAVEVE